jgi:sulfur carrier protein
MPYCPRGHEDPALAPAPVFNTIRVTVNGELRDLPGATSITDLILLLAIQGRYAVEHNGEIVPRSVHREHWLRDGDRVEVVAAIGGG